MNRLLINNRLIEVDVDPDTPLLWVLRDNLGLTGTKYACGTGICGSCTILVDGKPVRSCISPVDVFAGKSITTIEGIDDRLMQTVEEVWAETGASECGYCQPGQVMSALALLNETPKPTDVDIDNAMSGNLCRCGIYQRLRKAIHRLASIGVPGKYDGD